MDAFGMLKLIVLLAVFDVTLGTKYCCKQFNQRKYIPEYADGLKYTNLTVQYNDHTVKCGETVAFVETLNTPILKFDVTDKCPNVTVLGFSPDSILNPPYPFWLVFNVPSSALKKGFNNGGDVTDKLAGRSNQGDVIGPYIAPDDPTSQVRQLTVIYFIYCQCDYISDKRELDRIDRLHFDVKSYMKDHGLNCPVAGKFHQVSLTGLPAPLQVSPVPLPLLPLPYGSKSPVGDVVNVKAPV